MRTPLLRSVQVLVSLSAAALLMGADGQGCALGDAGGAASGVSGGTGSGTTVAACADGLVAQWLCDGPPPDPGKAPPPMGSGTSQPPPPPPPPGSDPQAGGGPGCP